MSVTITRPFPNNSSALPLDFPRIRTPVPAHLPMLSPKLTNTLRDLQIEKSTATVSSTNAHSERLSSKSGSFRKPAPDHIQSRVPSANRFLPISDQEDVFTIDRNADNSASMRIQFESSAEPNKTGNNAARSMLSTYRIGLMVGQRIIDNLRWPKEAVRSPLQVVLGPSYDEVFSGTDDKSTQSRCPWDNFTRQNMTSMKARAVLKHQNRKLAMDHEIYPKVNNQDLWPPNRGLFVSVLEEKISDFTSTRRQEVQESSDTLTVPGNCREKSPSSPRSTPPRHMGHSSRDNLVKSIFSVSADGAREPTAQACDELDEWISAQNLTIETHDVQQTSVPELIQDDQMSNSEPATPDRFIALPSFQQIPGCSARKTSESVPHSPSGLIPIHEFSQTPRTIMSKLSAQPPAFYPASMRLYKNDPPHYQVNSDLAQLFDCRKSATLTTHSLSGVSSGTFTSGQNYYPNADGDDESRAREENPRDFERAQSDCVRRMDVLIERHIRSNNIAEVQYPRKATLADFLTFDESSK